ncbi:ribonuclease P [Candidatus Woesearchaeota archaeon]|nr:ribonuclease P [Candidatus Woesearchaeota archaeon]|tara:strand:+ start:8080 stop:8406 length:327 start_codon:yes stop_codon:yes gene_type:complete
MANLLPSLREKKRYLVFEVIGNASCSDAVSSVKNSFSGLFGSLEAANADVSNIKSSGNKCMVRIGRKYVDKVKASMAIVKRINNSTIILRSIGVSGSLKRASKYFNGG